jgi:putative transposase
MAGENAKYVRFSDKGGWRRLDGYGVEESAIGVIWQSGCLQVPGEAGTKPATSLMGSYVALHYHMIFSTKQRRPLIGTGWRGALHDYLGGTVRGLDGDVRAVGGMEDHVHLLVTLDANHRIRDFLRELKKGSSIWAARNHCPGFAWQRGYAAFTVSTSGLDKVRRYIGAQEKHHEKLTFIEELRLLLEKHGVEFDPKYLE